MTPVDRKIEQDISAHTSRREQQDDLHREQVTLRGNKPKEGLQKQLHQRDQQMNQLDEHMLHTDQDWHKEQIEKSGPMGVWDAVAQKIEDYVEKHEK